MPIQAVIFDLDGTLLDTLADIAAAGNHALSQLGQPTHDPQAYRWFVGDGADVLVQRILPKNRQDLCPEALRHFKAYYGQHSADHTTLYPGITDLLDALTQRGLKLAVLSNKPHAATQQVIAHYFPGWSWSAVAGHRENIPKKPDPQAALSIAADMHVDPARTIFLGDSHVDMNTARSAGMIGVGAAWGFRTPEELHEAGARHIINAPAELLGLL